MRRLFAGLCVALALLSPARGQDHKDLQVPVTKESRIFNRTGQQCVYASLETLGKHHGHEKLVGLTNDPKCQGTTTPADVDAMLTNKGVKHVVLRHGDMHLEHLLETACAEHRGAVFGVLFVSYQPKWFLDSYGRYVLYNVPVVFGHAMTLVHYDKAGKVVKFIDNSDAELKVQTWDMDTFHQRWDGFAIIINPE